MQFGDARQPVDVGEVVVAVSTGTSARGQRWPSRSPSTPIASWRSTSTTAATRRAAGATASSPATARVDLVGAIRALEDAGFDGWYEFEVISDDGRVEHDFPDSLWRMDPLELITTGREKFLRIWEEARAGAAI